MNTTFVLTEITIVTAVTFMICLYYFRRLIRKISRLQIDNAKILDLIENTIISALENII